LISLLEVAERARSGPKMDEKKWNLSLFRKMQELTKEHDLVYSGPELFFDVDDSYCDAAFQAAVDFLVDMGVYCVTSNRVIQFTEDEVREAAREAPKEAIVGEGRDVRVIRKREVEDRKPVSIITGGHCPWFEDLMPLPLFVKSLAGAGRADIVEGFNFIKVDGRDVYDLPMAAYAAKRELAWMREGVQKAGRPGMAITYYPILTEASTLIAPIDPVSGLRRTDGILLSTLPDMKVEYDLLTAAIVYEEYGSFKQNGGAFAYIGGFCGGVEGAIIETIAKALAAWMVYRDVIQYSGEPTRLSVWTTIEERMKMEKTKVEAAQEGLPIVWSAFTVHNALCRNSNIIRFGLLSPIGLGGLETDSEERLLANSVAYIANTVLGANLGLVRWTAAEIEFAAEVSDATIKAGIKREDIRDIVQKAYERVRGKVAPGVYDERMLAYRDSQAWFGTFQRCYDFVRQRPTKSYLENREKVRKYLTDLGLELI